MQKTVFVPFFFALNKSDVQVWMCKNLYYIIETAIANIWAKFKYLINEEKIKTKFKVVLSEIQIIAHFIFFKMSWTRVTVSDTAKTNLWKKKEKSTKRRKRNWTKKYYSKRFYSMKNSCNEFFFSIHSPSGAQ